MAYENPIPYILDARRYKNQAQMQAFNTLAQAIGQGIGDVGAGLQKRQAKKAWMSAVDQAMANNPGFAPYAQLAKAAGPDATLQYLISPLIKQKGMQQKPQSSYWINPQDPTDVSAEEKPGYVEYKTSAADAGSKVLSAAQAKAHNKAISSRADAWERSIDVRQIDELAKRIGITSRQQSQLQQNTFRASRAIPILSKPNITYQELAFGEIDLAGIMQGGVPHVDEVHNTHFPGWQEQWSRLKTYALGHPNENVPEPIRQKVLSMVKDVIQVDNRFLKAHTKFSKEMLLPTIRGGGQNMVPAIDQMTRVLTPEHGNTNNEASSMSDEELRRIAAGGQ